MDYSLEADPRFAQVGVLSADTLVMTGGQMADDRRVAAGKRESLPLSADQIERIRARIDAGVYASDMLLQATARAILERGGLE